MAARDMYIMKIIREHHLNDDNLEEVYEIVCKHFEEVELTKLTLEKMIWKKKYDALMKQEMEKVKGELKGYLKEDDDPEFEALLKQIENLNRK